MSGEADRGSQLKEAKGSLRETTDEQARTPGTNASYPSGFKLASVIISLLLAVFCVALDNTIIATAIPRITDEFHALQDVGWYGSSYLLTTCSFQLLFGKFYTHFSIKWVFLVALFLFELGSLICGVAPSSTALIVGRAIAGFGSSGIFTGALVTIAHLVPLHKRPTFLGMIGGMYGIASVAGPLMGGAFTDRVTWRWCFYINRAVTAVGILFFLHISSPPKQIAEGGIIAKLAQFDPVGTALFVPSIICLLLALQWGGTTYPWSDGRIVALFVLFGVLLIAFVAVQIWMDESATVPPRIATQRSVTFGALFAICIGASFFIFMYYLPIWFQAIRNASPVQSGIDTLPFILAQVFGTIVAGGMTTKLGYYMPFVFASVILMSIGAGLLTLFTVNISTGKWVGYQILFGVGAGFGFQQAGIAAQACLDLADVPIGTAMLMFVQLLGGAMFVSIGQNIFVNDLASSVQQLNIPGLDPAALAQSGATQFRNFVDPAHLNDILVGYNGALVKTFQVALIMACLSVLGAAGMEWKSVKGRELGPGGA